MSKTAIIIGAGPAGLTAAYEFLTRTDIKPIVLEATRATGGISQTINYKNNRIDIGGHRFFSKSDRVMNWWLNILPPEAVPGSDGSVEVFYRNQSRPVAVPAEAPDPRKTDKVMLVRSRLSRIFYLRRFFSYPISLSAETIRNLGILRMTRIGASYLLARARPIKPERSLEDFFINRFGRELYLTFFKDYTEKVWGVPCDKINPDWGAQRVKGLSITTALLHAARRALKPADASMSQKGVETSLIERFLYPKYGPGQMWEEVSRRVLERGGEIHHQRRIVGLHREDNRIVSVNVRNEDTGEVEALRGDYFLSTMPVQELVRYFDRDAPVPGEVKRVSDGLMYRDFMTVGLLLSKLKVRNPGGEPGLIKDNWIYIQERDVKIGRLQIFNNWSEFMIDDPRNTVWLGLEYFCNEGDALWSKSDDDFKAFAIEELARIGIIDAADVLDGVVIRMPKTYPSYTGSYDEFPVVQRYVDQFENLFLIGRNGMHRYNNQDHSMLTAMVTVENIMNNVKTKDNIWSVNVEQEYHETKKVG
jgi:protoporphyrinogen oxidase